MKVNELLPGCKVDIHLNQLVRRSSSEDQKQGVYYTSIFDVLEDGTLEMQMPISAGRMQLLPRNVRYEFFFSTSKGVYKANGTVTKHFRQRQFYLMKVELTSSLEKFQRREYYRLVCHVPVTFCGISEEVAQKATTQQVLLAMDEMEDGFASGEGTLLDLSGGGAKFVSTQKLQDVHYLWVQFELLYKDVSRVIQTVALLLSGERTQDGGKYLYRIKFCFKENQMKEQIIGFIFEEERRLRKKEQG